MQCSATSDLAAAVANADVVVEAIPEKLELKRSVLSAVHEAAPTALLATNTSVIPIADIAAGLPETAELVGTHWWNPPHLIRIVEVVAGPRVQEASIERICALLAECGKRPVMVADVPGFVGNRLQFALWREAMHIVESGYCDAETVDLIARETFGRRLPALGPLENADYIGLELTREIMSYVLPSLSTAKDAPALLLALLDGGTAGAKAGRGFMDWNNDRISATRQRLTEQLQQT